MILFLDIEHPSSLADPRYREERQGTMERRRALFEELSGEPCEIRHYTGFRSEELHSPEVSALVTSGNRALWECYDLERDFTEFARSLHERPCSILGICGGHQLAGLLLGGEAGPLGPLEAGEADQYPDYAPGMRKEWGFSQVAQTAPDPLFDGLADRFTVNQAHFWQLTRLPPELEPIASSPFCGVQAMRHKAGGLYGVQFHPEFSDAAHPDGTRLLRNFFAISKEFSGQ